MKAFLDLRFEKYRQAPQFDNLATNIVQNPKFWSISPEDWNEQQQPKKKCFLAKFTPVPSSDKETFLLVDPCRADAAVRSREKINISKKMIPCLAITFSPLWDTFSPSPGKFPKCDVSGFLLYCVLTRILSMYYGMVLDRVNAVLLQSTEAAASSDIYISTLNNNQMSNLLQATICHLLVKSNGMRCFVLFMMVIGFLMSFL
jgi:hypothetical protein